MDFARMVVKARRTQFSSSRKFYLSFKEHLQCSYQRYAAIERGELPSVPLALTIARLLNINERSALKALARDKMPDEVLKSYFIDVDEIETDNRNTKKEIKINRMQARLLKENPVYFDILTYLACYSEHKSVTEDELARALNLSKDEIISYLRNLYDFGLIDKAKDYTYTLIGWVILPDDEEFNELRNINFSRSLENHRQRGFNQKAIQYTTTRLVTDKQRELVRSKAKQFTEWLVSLPEDPQGRPYTIIIGGNERYEDPLLNIKV